MSTDVITASRLVRQRVKELMQQAGGSPQKIADTIRMDDPDLYEAFLDEQATYMFQRAVADMFRSVRSVERDRRQVDKINDMLKAGNLDVVSIMDIHAEGIDGLMRVGEMTKDDHIAAAVSYELLSSESLYYAKVHRMIARKLKPGQRTEERFTEEELRSIYKKYEGGS